MQENGNDYAIKSVMKAVQMLKLVASNSPATFTELLEQSPFPKATAFRLIYTLEAAGLIECRDGKYVLSSLLLELGLNAKNQLGFGSISRGLLESLGETLNETVNLGIPNEASQVVYIDKVVNNRLLRVDYPIGFSVPSYCTALGKAILAYLPADARETHLQQIGKRWSVPIESLRAELTRIRRCGYAIDDRELDESLRCIAFPIFDNSQVVAAVSISGPAHRLSRDDLVDFAPLGLQTAEEISKQIGCSRYKELIREGIHNEDR